MVLTNKDKYLKDGVDVYEIANGINEAYLDSYDEEDLVDCVARWFNTTAKPTLTEDEKVILKSIKDDNWAIIGKTDFNELYLSNYCKNCDVFVKEIFKKGLFQFIQPRRRI